MKPTTAQAASQKLLAAQGFIVDYQDSKAIRMVRGNDFRLVQQDGIVKRAIGARR